MSKVCTLDLLVELLRRKPRTVGQLATWFGMEVDQVEQLLKRLRRRREAEGEGLFIHGYTGRAVVYRAAGCSGHRAALWSYGGGVDVSYRAWLFARKKAQVKPIEVEAHWRVRLGRAASPWDALLIGMQPS